MLRIRSIKILFIPILIVSLVLPYFFSLFAGNAVAEASAFYSKADRMGAVVKIATGGDSSHVLALLSDGSVWAWGNNASGQLGMGNNNNGASYPENYSPRMIPSFSPGSGVTDIAVGGSTSFALKGGVIYAWGANGSGVVGDGTNSGDQVVPVRVGDGEFEGGNSGISKISAGTGHRLAVKDGVVYAWGAGNSGKLGMGDTQGYWKVVKITDAPTNGFINENVSDVFASQNSSYAVQDGVVYSWGLATNGVLGNGSSSGSLLRPTKVLNGEDGATPFFVNSNVSQIEGGWNHISVLREGIVYSWGGNNAGQLGDGTTIERTRPVMVVDNAEHGFVNEGVSWLGRGQTSMYLLQKGIVFGWGRNNSGQIGVTGSTDFSRPVKVMDNTAADFVNEEVTQIIGSNSTAFALKGGEVFSWGHNVNGVWGDGTTATSSTRTAPSRVGTPEDLAILAVERAENRRTSAACSVAGINASGTVQPNTPLTLVSGNLQIELRARLLVLLAEINRTSSAAAFASDFIELTANRTALDTISPSIYASPDNGLRARLDRIVTGVRLNKSTTNIEVGETETLMATVLPETARNKKVTWSTNAPGVATIDPATGLVTGVSPGSAVLTATTADGFSSGTTNYTATCTVTVGRPVKGISLNQAMLSLTVGGGNGSLVATLNPTNASTETVTWSSSNPSVVPNPSGTALTATIVPNAAGTANITVTSTDGNYKAVCTVTVSPAVTVPVKGVSLDRTVMSLTVGGGSSTLSAILNPTNATNQAVTWSSSSPDVATVTNGVISPIAVGVTNITVTSSDGNYRAVCTVTVNPAITTPVKSVILDKTVMSLTIGGGTGSLVASINPSNASNTGLSWLSSDSSVATVSGGVVTPLKVGITNIIVTTNDGGFQAVCTVTVNPTVTTPVKGVSLDRTTMALTVGEGSGTLTAILNPTNATNQAVVWSSSVSEVATVTNGIVTAVGAGTTHITVTTSDGNFKAVCTVTVNPEILVPIKSVSLDRTTLKLAQNGTAELLTATINPENASNTAVAWTTSNPSVATVTGGMVTPLAKGKANITVTTVDGNFKAVCTVEVVEDLDDGLVSYPRIVTGYNGAVYSIGTDRKLSVWGDNSAKQLGMDSPAIQTTPIPNPTLVDVKLKEIVLGYDNGKAVYAITATNEGVTGEVYSWGTYSNGNLGTGANTTTSTPAKVVDSDDNPITGVKNLILGNNGQTIFAICTNGDIYAWGYGSGNGSTGTGENENSLKAVKVVTQGVVALSDVDTLLAGYYNEIEKAQSMYAISKTGDIYTWGDNSKGQLAAGDTMNNVWRNRKAIALDATGDDGTWAGNGKEWTMDVTIPIVLNFAASNTGSLLLPSNPEFTIENHATQPVKIVSSDYAVGEWSLVNAEPNLAINSKEFKVGAQYNGKQDLLTVLKEGLPNQTVWGEKWKSQGEANISFAMTNDYPVAKQTEGKQLSAGTYHVILTWF